MPDEVYVLSKQEYEGLKRLLRQKTIAQEPHIPQAQPQHQTYVKVTAAASGGWYPAIVQVSSGDGTWTDYGTCELQPANDGDTLLIGSRYESRRTGDKSDGTARYRCISHQSLAMISVGSSTPDVNGWYQGAGYTYDVNTNTLVQTIPVCFVHPPETGGGSGHGLHQGDIIMAVRIDDLDGIPRFLAYASQYQVEDTRYTYRCENGNLIETATTKIITAPNLRIT